eukprot:SAG31_NODE_32325_length_357_cov_0.806202_2_plen_42_part_01
MTGPRQLSGEALETGVLAIETHLSGRVVVAPSGTIITRIVAD